MSDDTPKVNSLLSESSNTEPEAEPEPEGEPESKEESENNECKNNCSIKCIDELIDQIKEKKRKLNLYRKILEIKYTGMTICQECFDKKWSSVSYTTIKCNNE